MVLTFELSNAIKIQRAEDEMKRGSGKAIRSVQTLHRAALSSKPYV